MDQPQCAVLLCVAFLGGQPASPQRLARLAEIPRSTETAGTFEAAADESHSGQTPRITRMEPVPVDAPVWTKAPPGLARGTQEQAATTTAGPADTGRIDAFVDNLLLVDVAPPDARARARSWQDEGARDAPSASRNHNHHEDDLSALGDVGDLAAQDDRHRGLYGRPPIFRHRDDFDGSVWEEASSPNGPDPGRGPPFRPVLAPSLLGINTDGDSSLDLSLPDKQDDHHGEVHVADGRGPIIVRGPPFNSVAIGFLIYLILLTVLQSSIFNMTKKGQLGLGLRPARDRSRRDLELRMTLLNEGNAGSTRISEHFKRDPVLVAAVRNMEPGRDILGGRRRVRRSVLGKTGYRGKTTAVPTTVNNPSAHQVITQNLN